MGELRKLERRIAKWKAKEQRNAEYKQMTTEFSQKVAEAKNTITFGRSHRIACLGNYIAKEFPVRTLREKGRIAIKT